MREIKFRAWDQERKKMIYEFKTSGWEKSTYRLLHEENGLMCANYLDNGDWNEPILMQYTGLLDKNRKEIYEGDIVQQEVEELYQFNHGAFSNHEVIYRSGLWIVSYLSSEKGFVLPRGYLACDINEFRSNGNKEMYFMDDPRIDELVIIGNIYSNPELLKP